MSERSLPGTIGRAFATALVSNPGFRTEYASALEDVIFMIPDLSQDDWFEIKELIARQPATLQVSAPFEELAREALPSDRRPIAQYLIQKMVDGHSCSNAAPALIEQLIVALEHGNWRSAAELAARLVLPSIQLRREPDAPHLCRKRIEIWQPVLADSKVICNTEPFDQRFDGEECDELCLLGTLIARVAHSDGKADEAERAIWRTFLQSHWKLPEDRTEFLVNISLHFPASERDVVRICRWYYERSTAEERIAFIDLLFKIALIDGDLSEGENDEIMNIAANLHIGHEHFQNALVRNGGSPMWPLESA